jgi:hypothetical protein
MVAEVYQGEGLKGFFTGLSTRFVEVCLHHYYKSVDAIRLY